MVRGIVNMLLVAGANIYAKTDGDLLPVQLATDPATLEYLSAQMKSDMEDRISLKQTKFASAGPGSRFSSFLRPTSADQDQWTESAWVANNRSTSFSEVGGTDRIMREAINRNTGVGYQDREILGPVQSFREGANTEPGFGGVDRQSSLNFASQAIGSRLMDWEAVRNSPSDLPNQGLVHRAFTNQSPNEWSNFIFNPSMDVWMQDGTGHSKGSFTRPSFEQPLQEKYDFALC